MRHLITSIWVVVVVSFTFSTLVLAEENTYTVRPGDSLWKISRNMQVDLNELIKINELHSDLIYSGTVLKLPSKNNSHQSSPNQDIHNSTNNYHVQKGDNLWTLSRTYQVTVSEIKKINGLHNDLILVGQVLEIPRETKHISLRAASFTNENEQTKAINQADNYIDDEHEWLAKIIEAEAGNQSYLGKVAVASVVMNRKNDVAFPDTIKDVIFQKGQFSPVANGRIHKVKPTEDSLRAAQEALLGTQDPTEGALFFYNPKIAKDKWIRTREVTKDIGQHRFAL